MEFDAKSYLKLLGDIRDELSKESLHPDSKEALHSLLCSAEVAVDKLMKCDTSREHIKWTWLLVSMACVRVDGELAPEAAWKLRHLLLTAHRQITGLYNEKYVK